MSQTWLHPVIAGQCISTLAQEDISSEAGTKFYKYANCVYSAILCHVSRGGNPMCNISMNYRTQGYRLGSHSKFLSQFRLLHSTSSSILFCQVLCCFYHRAHTLIVRLLIPLWELLTIIVCELVGGSSGSPGTGFDSTFLSLVWSRR